jgi:predicted Zn finger-like uncharacterized protein
MIIECNNCSKKFEVDSSLIPETGRNIQCGSCNHTWFYKHVTQTTSSNVNNNKSEENFSEINLVKDAIIENKNLIEKNKINSSPKANKSTIFNLGNLLSYALAGIISFIALVMFLDTFKSPLNNLFPNLELLLYNLYETIKDMFLFFKNLINS